MEVCRRTQRKNLVNDMDLKLILKHDPRLCFLIVRGGGKRIRIFLINPKKNSRLFISELDIISVLPTTHRYNIISVI